MDDLGVPLFLETLMSLGWVEPSWGKKKNSSSEKNRDFWRQFRVSKQLPRNVKKRPMQWPIWGHGRVRLIFVHFSVVIGPIWIKKKGGWDLQLTCHRDVSCGDAFFDLERFNEALQWKIRLEKSASLQTCKPRKLTWTDRLLEDKMFCFKGCV